MKTVLRVESFEDRITPATGLDSGYETYAWVLINNLRQDPTAFANNIQGLINGTVNSAFGFSKADPVIADLKGMISHASSPGNYAASLAMMRATSDAGPLAWDNLLQSLAAKHNTWMKANGFAHSDTTGHRTALPGFTSNDAAAPDTWSVGAPTYTSWGEDIGWAVGSLSSTKAAYNAGGVSLVGLQERAAFLDTVGYMLELNSSDLGHLENLLGRDSGTSATLPSFNVIGADIDLFEAPAQYETQDGIPEAWLSTHRLGMYQPNGTGGFIAGIAYQDTNKNGFFDAGEGAAVTVNIRDANGNGVTDTLAASNYGAFSDYLPNGTYTVTASAAGALLATKTATIANSNAWAELMVSGVGRPTVTGPTGRQGMLRPTVAWNGVDGSTGYQIKVDDLTSGISNLFPGVATTATSWSPASDLVSGHGYEVLVRAVRGQTLGPWSNPDLFSLTLPKLAVATTDGLRPTFSWTGIAGATYKVRLDDLQTGLTNLFPKAATTDTSWTVPADLVSGHSYQWQVRAVNAAGMGDWSRLATVTIAKPKPTGPVNGVEAIRPAFTWTPVGGATAYMIQLTDVSANVPALYTGHVTDPVWSPAADLVSGRTYSWHVRALNAAGLGDWTLPATFALGKAVPIGPGGATTGLRPTFSWAGIAGDNNYQVRVDDLTTGQTKLYLPLVSMEQAWTPGSNLTSGHTYRWWVRALTSGGPGIWFGRWSAPSDFQIL